MKKLNWNEYFIILAKITALRSNDDNTKVGAIIVNDRKRILGTGYNGMPQGDDSFPWKKDANKKNETKYPYVIHAELNAILNSTTDIKGSEMYVTLFPCSSCAKLLAHSEIKKIYYLEDKYHDEEDTKISRFIFDKLGVKYIKLDSINVEIKKATALKE